MTPEGRIDAALALFPGLGGSMWFTAAAPGCPSLVRALHAAARDIRDAERERCARLVEAAVPDRYYDDDGMPVTDSYAALLCAADAIRAGDEPPSPAAPEVPRG